MATHRPSSRCAIPRGIIRIDAGLGKLDEHRAIAYYPVAGRIWTAVDNVYRTIFVEGEHSVIAFDTFDTPGAARSYRVVIERIFPDKPIRTLIYSHDHLDHTGFGVNVAPEAEVIAHELCAGVVEARGADGQLAVTRVVSGERELVQLDGVRFELLYPGPTHGDGCIAAHFPEQGVLFMVDTIATGAAYTFYPDMHLGSWLKAMKRLLGLEWSLFVPGHFWPLSRREFEENIRFHERLEEAAQQAIADEVDQDDYEAVGRYAMRLLKPEFGRGFRFNEYAAQNLWRAIEHYRMGGWGFEGNARIPDAPFAPR
jgi:glyoxylase-like metal-dependent hydrolase (beta-lactamase superfamily II)